MDRVRLGRALGYGARHAAKSLMQAAEAAAAPGPAKPAGAPAPARPVIQAARKVEALRQQKQQLKRSIWSPVKKFSSVLWLEVTGSFFALFAVVMGQGLWKLRSGFRASPNSPEAHKLYLYALVFAVFAYFAVSSFVRARRRQRR